MKILSEPKFKTQIAVWNSNKSDIPNEVGFPLVVKCKIQGNEFLVITKVIKDTLFPECHCLDGVRILDVISWRRATPEEIALKPE